MGIPRKEADIFSYGLWKRFALEAAEGNGELERRWRMYCPMFKRSCHGPTMVETLDFIRLEDQPCAMKQR